MSTAPSADPGTAQPQGAPLAWDAATLDLGLREALAGTLAAEPRDVGATLRPPATIEAIAQGPTVDSPLGGGPATTDGYSLTTLPRVTWQDDSTQAPAAPATSGADLHVQGLLGEGGMGRVMLAWQRSLHREVALKTVKAEVDRPEARVALWREAVVMGQLDHPHIVPVHVLGADAAGRPALVMKRVEGRSWQEELADPALAALAPAERLTRQLGVLRKVAEALAFAYARGVIHRDVKPENVMVGAWGEVFLADWGVAMALATSDAARDEPVGLAGTPCMVAPEMLLGRRGALGPWTDVFLLGATLHQVLTGRPRHGGRTVHDVLRSVAACAPAVYDDGVPAALAALANAATTAVPARRIGLSEFVAGIDDYLRLQALEPVVEAAWQRLREAEARAAEVRAVCGDPERFAAVVGELQDLGVEARFGLRQVIAANPGHARARAGLRLLRQLQLGLEVDAGQVGRARAVLAEIEREDPEDAAAAQAQVDALQGRLDREAAERAALLSLQRDHDPRVGRRARLAFLAPIGALGAVLFLWVAWRQPMVDVAGATRLAWINSLVVWIASALTWRRARSQVNRQLIVGACVVTIATLTHRLLSQRLGTPLDAVLVGDALMVGAVIAMSPVASVGTRLLAPALLWATALAIARWPAEGSILFSTGLTSALVVLLWVGIRFGGEPAAGDAA